MCVLITITMGAGASIASVSSELLDLERNAIGSQRNIVVPKLISNEQLLNEIKRRSTNPDSGRKFSFSKRRPTTHWRAGIGCSPHKTNSQMKITCSTCSTQFARKCAPPH